MPAVSRAQQRLMQAAEHGADFPAANKIRQSMTHQQMHDFAVGAEKGKPEHVKPAGPAKRDSAAHVQHQAAVAKRGEHLGWDHEPALPSTRGRTDSHGSMRYK